VDAFYSCNLARQRKSILVGGQSSSAIAAYHNDMWVYNIHTGVWMLMNPDEAPDYSKGVNNPGIPLARAYHMFWRGLNGTFYFYGGLQGIFAFEIIYMTKFV
jgi:hypothetical protein